MTNYTIRPVDAAGDVDEALFGGGCGFSTGKLVESGTVVGKAVSRGLQSEKMLNIVELSDMWCRRGAVVPCEVKRKSKLKSRSSMPTLTISPIHPRPHRGRVA